MTRKGKKRMVMIIGLLIGIILQVNKVEAALQSNGGTAITANVNDWIYYTRQMQATGGTLGLTDTISDTDLSSTNKNLDIHFQKNTEYGAVAILSASAYGNPEKIADGGTTTGNASGVVVNLNGEWVAAARNGTVVWAMQVAKSRYWNNYADGDGSNSKVGDAMLETNGWHGSTGNVWLRHVCGNGGVSPAVDAAFVRSLSSSLFTFNGYSLNSYGWSYDGSYCPIHGGYGYNEGDKQVRFLV